MSQNQSLLTLLFQVFVTAVRKIMHKKRSGLIEGKDGARDGDLKLLDV